MGGVILDQRYTYTHYSYQLAMEYFWHTLTTQDAERGLQ